MQTLNITYQRLRATPVEPQEKGSWYLARSANASSVPHIIQSFFSNIDLHKVFISSSIGLILVPKLRVCLSIVAHVKENPLASLV